MVHIPLRLVLDGGALVSNWHWLAHRSGGAACGAAVKADAYGLGAREAVKRLQHAGCRDFFVSTWAEASALMPWPSDLALSVFHGVGPDDLADALSSPARPVLNTPEQVRRWRESGQGRPCDVMVDTGMNRLGLTPEQARSGILDGLRVQTLMSHLACADEPDHAMNERQLAAFKALRQDIPAVRYSLANSAGICLGATYGFQLTRPGLALYGGIPMLGDSAQEEGIRPVVSVEAQVVQLRDVPAGGSVGYGCTYIAKADEKVAILNLGYADGFLRMLGNHSVARIGDHALAVVGRVSMDLLAVRASTSAKVDGAAESEPLPVAEGDWIALDYPLARLAVHSGLSQYELLTMLGARYDRVWK